MPGPGRIANRWQMRGLAALSGLLAGLGQAPFDLWVLAIAGFAGLVFLTIEADAPRAAAGRLWIGGAAYFAVALHWIVEPFFVDLARHGWMAPFAILFMAAGLALFWAAAGWLSTRLLLGGAGPSRALALIGALCVAEWARAHVLTGFPWAHPGHILIDTGYLGLAAWVGPHGLTLLVLGIAGVLAILVQRRFGILAGAALLAMMAAVGLWMAPPPASAVASDRPVLRLVQPNAPQHLKWQPEMIPVFFQRGLDLTAAGPDPDLGAPDLVIWPETSLPELLNQSEISRQMLADASGDALLIAGAQRIDGVTGRNSLVVLNADGAIMALYDKHHLVPFGEYIPLGAWLSRVGIRGLAQALQSGYRPGPGPVVLDLGDLGQAFAMICYEAIFPGYIRQVTRPDWMVHITNDAWFGEFSGPYQHLALARLRAVEQGVPLVRAANTGISAVIDGRGRIIDSLPLGQAGHLDIVLPQPLPPTVYARMGDGPVLGMLLLLLLTSAIGRARPIGH